ncbi:MAG: ABC transporter ATP-binding protein [Anaerolineae bacterium]
MIQVENLTRRYGDFTALDNISFYVEKGEILGFLGPNGAGKTTTMRILTAYLPPSDGRVRVAGYDVFSDSLDVRRRVGYLPETVPVYPEMTVVGYLDYVAALRKVPRRKVKVEEALARVGLLDQAEMLIGKLSKGMRQRVGIAQTLVHDPEVLILDEPTIGLDPKQIIHIRELIRNLGGERTVILSTHILSEVEAVCSRVLIINNGRLVAEDTPQRLTHRLKVGEQVRLRLQSPADDVVERLMEVEGVISVSPSGENMFDVECGLGQDLRPVLAATVVQRGWGLLEMCAVDLKLEDVFLQLTRE